MKVCSVTVWRVRVNFGVVQKSFTLIEKGVFMGFRDSSASQESIMVEKDCALVDGGPLLSHPASYFDSELLQERFQH